MVNTRALLDKMDEMGFRQRDIAQAINCSQSTVSLKINNKRPLFLDEAEKLQSLLDIKDSEFRFFFLVKNVA